MNKKQICFKSKKKKDDSRRFKLIKIKVTSQIEGGTSILIKKTKQFVLMQNFR